jgi:hypothetical protein
MVKYQMILDHHFTHAATGVLLYLGAKPSQQPLDSGNTHDTADGTSNLSGRFLKKPVRPVWQTGQAGFVHKLPKTLQEPFLL